MLGFLVTDITIIYCEVVFATERFHPNSHSGGVVGGGSLFSLSVISGSRLETMAAYGMLTPPSTPVSGGNELALHKPTSPGRVFSAYYAN